MCILFLHTQTSSTAGRFRLILAANRDEYYIRPALPIHFWKEDETVIGGRDLEPGKEGGTWLALSAKNGKLGALLNIMMPGGKHPPHLLGRGSLLANFVRNNVSCSKYLQEVAGNGANYRPFNLLTLHLRKNDADMYVYSNVGSQGEPIKITENCFGISNSEFNTPFLKVTAGTERFKQIVQNYGDITNKDSLINELHTFLQWKESHFPDPVLTERAPQVTPEFLLPLSSVFVNNMNRSYGTRAHSIILMDDEGHTDFYEWSMKCPIEATNPVWEYNHLTCQVHLQ
ncbi:transport and Golgi organization 2 homolog [Schistocerca piceifrons]|uniref:transport and Golgi organization 2 homolog n=1 Tax=Schistocerca piceifrons TaxID=274613 RepID=UPI001F5EDEED|nr:transport and Golgi organization 2 homolog [Schistocerca piceifrons]